MYKQVVICVLACACGALACVTDENRNTVASSLATLSPSITALVNAANMSDPNRTHIYIHLAEMICNQSMTGTERMAMKAIFDQLRPCPQLATDAQAGLAMLVQDGVTFTDMVRTFQYNLENVCMCPKSVACATKVNVAAKTWSTGSSTYNELSRAPVLCSLKKEFTCLEKDALSNCPSLPMYAGLMDIMELNKIIGFTDFYCDKHNQEDWDCALRRSEVTGFDNCVIYSRGQGVGGRCGVRQCVDEFIEQSCGKNATDVYIAAVNIPRTGDEVILGATCGASSLHMALSVLVMTLMSLYLHNL